MKLQELKITTESGQLISVSDVIELLVTTKSFEALTYHVAYDSSISDAHYASIGRQLERLITGACESIVHSRFADAGSFDGPGDAA